jgi:hypothetical protein
MRNVPLTQRIRELQKLRKQVAGLNVSDRTSVVMSVPLRRN